MMKSHWRGSVMLSNILWKHYYYDLMDSKLLNGASAVIKDMDWLIIWLLLDYKFSAAASLLITILSCY